jgi:FemAB-related protein (PEP-CTERM system-associated)
LSSPQQILDLAEPSAIEVREFRAADQQRWDDFVQVHPGASIFHSTRWMRAVERTFGYTPRYCLAERGGTICGIVPLFLVSNWITGRCLISTPFAVYGGIVAADDKAADMLLRHVTGMAKAEKVEYLELRNRRAQSYEDFHRKSLYVAFGCELLPDVEANLKRLPRDTRYMIRKAEKNGLSSRYGFDQMPRFYELFATSMQRLGTPVFPRALFMNLAAEFGDSVDLMLVYSGNTAVSGVLTFYFRDQVIPYYAGASPQANKLAANNYMYWVLMQRAVERGCRWFDFGRSKKGTGAYAFKTQWSMQVEDLPYEIMLVQRDSVPNFSPANPKFEMATKVWQKLPMGMTKLLGPHVVKWFP